MAASPSPKKQDVDERIDDCIAKIDAAIPVIRQRAAAAREATGTPSPERGFSTQNFMRTQRVLNKIAKEIDESDDDIDIEQLRRESKLLRIMPSDDAASA